MTGERKAPRTSICKSVIRRRPMRGLETFGKYCRNRKRYVFQHLFSSFFFNNITSQRVWPKWSVVRETADTGENVIPSEREISRGYV